MVAFRAAPEPIKPSRRNILTPAQQLEAIRYAQGLSKTRTVVDSSGQYRTQRSNRGGRITKAAKKEAKRRMEINGETMFMEIDTLNKAMNTMTAIISMVKMHVNDPNIRAKVEQMDYVKLHALLKGEDNPIAEMVFNYTPDLSRNGWANTQIQNLIDIYEQSYGSIEIKSYDNITEAPVDTSIFGAWGVRR